LNDVDGPLPGFQGHGIFEVEYLKKVHLRDTKNTNRKPYLVYRMAPLSMTLIDPWLGFQGRDIFRHWISQKRPERESHSYYRTSI